MISTRQEHWNAAYGNGDSVSWYEASPLRSFELISSLGDPPDRSVVDIGGGNSRLVDSLLGAGRTDVSVLDVSGEALEIARKRLGDLGDTPDWIVADLLTWTPARKYDVWHDRAVLHFLTSESDRDAYRAVLARALAPGGAIVIGVFAEDGPEKCSGLPVTRYSADDLRSLLGAEFEVLSELRDVHVTPGGNDQPFNWIVARRR